MTKKPSSYSTDLAIEEIQNQVAKILDKSGLYYRIFARCKSDFSTQQKLSTKAYNRENGYLMQDYIGVRIALYFYDDIPICEEIIRHHFNVISKSSSNQDSETFSPVVLNLICTIPEHSLGLIQKDLWEDFLFDKTFEIQIRTIFSEGWHEIEHDVRYKCKEDWARHQDLGRNMNGILATLETCDWSMVAITNELAYREYKNKEWSKMVKDKLRIHLTDSKISEQLSRLLDENNDLAKSIFRYDRSELLVYLTKIKTKLPLTANNMVFLINHLSVKHPDICKITPAALNNILGECS